MNTRLQLIGQVFGRLTVVSSGPVVSKKTTWKCQCECGNTTTKVGSSLVKGNVRSCGCINRELMRNLSRELAQRPSTARIRGQSESKQYRTWGGIKSRCFNANVKDFKHYGAIGITVCKGWLSSFDAFADDIGLPPTLEHTIDRIDGKQNYSCGHCDDCFEHGWTANCRWATTEEQNRNQKANVWLEHDGRRMLLIDWSRETGIHSGIITDRIRVFMENGIDREKAVSLALTTPLVRRGTGTSLTLMDRVG